MHQLPSLLIFILQHAVFVFKVQFVQEVSIGEYSITYTVLYSVCVNADLLIHDRVASALEHAESQ